MNLISGIDVTASALTAQKTRLDVVAQNIANAQTTRTAGGGPYQRQVVSFETELLRNRELQGLHSRVCALPRLRPTILPASRFIIPSTRMLRRMAW